MNLKEAQLLGILALIAVGIILLCMWGGGDTQDVVADAGGISTVGDISSEPSISEIFEHVRREGVSQEAPPVPEPIEVEMEIGGPDPTVDLAAPNEEDLIRSYMEEIAPEEIPLAPREAPPAFEEDVRPAAPMVPRTHIVQKGDTLSTISQQYYHTAKKWRLIHEANKKLIPNPDVLPLGVKLTIPPTGSRSTAQVASASSTRAALSATTSKTASKRKTYVVREKDTLYRVALRCYEDGSKWRDILAANSDKLQSPRDLRVGMTIVIP